MLLVLSLSVGISASGARTTSSPTIHPPRPTAPFVVHRPPIPINLYFECVGQPFDYIEETLTKDWAGFRTDLSDARDQTHSVLYDAAHGQS